MNITLRKDLREALIAALMGVPRISSGNAAARDALLAGIPLPHLRRDPANAQNDVMLLVWQLEQVFGLAGEWYLRQLVDNARLGIEGTELGHELVRLGQELAHELQAARQALVRPDDVAQVHLFDLTQPTNVCVLHLLQMPGPGLSGFMLATPTDKLLRYFCERLKRRGSDLEVWRREAVAPVVRPLMIDPVHTKVEDAIEWISRRRSVLEKRIVIAGVYLRENADAEALWRGVSAHFEGALENHLIVVFGMQEAAAPPGMQGLPPPTFSPNDLSDWVRAIVRTAAWEEALVDRWTRVIIERRREEPVIGWIYDELEEHVKLLKKDQSQAEFVRELDDYEKMGG
jgi:hypothetical protein